MDAVEARAISVTSWPYSLPSVFLLLPLVTTLLRSRPISRMLQIVTGGKVQSRPVVANLWSVRSGRLTTMSLGT